MNEVILMDGLILIVLLVLIPGLVWGMGIKSSIDRERNLKSRGMKAKGHYMFPKAVPDEKSPKNKRYWQRRGYFWNGKKWEKSYRS